MVRVCRRAGSLDASIDPRSVEPNEVAGLLARCPRVRTVLFNGAPAERLFRRHVAPGLRARASGLSVVRLPSTSPAHAALSPSSKRAAWLAALDLALCAGRSCARMPPRGRSS